jgi:hypothetical protein
MIMNFKYRKRRLIVRDSFFINDEWQHAMMVYQLLQIKNGAGYKHHFRFME